MPEAGPPSPSIKKVPPEVRLMGWALGFLLITSVVGFLAAVTIPNYKDPGFTVRAMPDAFWDRFARYDSGWYRGIAADGYAFIPGGRSNLAFFPLYPLLMRYGGHLLGG